MEGEHVMSGRVEREIGKKVKTLLGEVKELR